MSIQSGNSDYLVLPIQPSKLLTLLCLVAYGLGELSLILIGVEYLWVLILCLPLGVHAHNTLKTTCLQLNKNAIVLCKEMNGIWYVQTKEGQTFALKLAQKAYRTPWLIVLPFKYLHTRKKLNLILTCDALSKDDYTRVLYKLWR